MLCRKPFVKAGVAHGCGQCLPCRIKRKKEWTHRILLEMLCHTENSFITLTYSNESLATIGSVSKTGLYQLNPEHLQRWLKKLRERISPLKMRFYAVGEYGDASFRPHYHVILFGVHGCARGRTKRKLGSNEPDWENCCSQCRLIGETWGYGIIEIGELNPHSAAYIAEYTIKKMTRYDDDRLNGRHPEFARMSLKPGIGHDSLWQLASDMFRFHMEDMDDVPHQLMHGKMKFPLGRYLRRKLRKLTGKEEATPENVLQKMEEEMRPLREAAFNDSASFSSKIVEAYSQAALNQQAKREIYKRKHVI